MSTVPWFRRTWVLISFALQETGRRFVNALVRAVVDNFDASEIGEERGSAYKFSSRERLHAFAEKTDKAS
jgi:hypothetical protein